MPRRMRQTMPDDVRDALEKAGVQDDYDARPPYQRNDYLGWIARARTDGTRRSRIEKMLDELKAGGVYMGMRHKPSEKAP